MKNLVVLDLKSLWLILMNTLAQILNLQIHSQLGHMNCMVSTPCYTFPYQAEVGKVLFSIHTLYVVGISAGYK